MLKAVTEVDRRIEVSRSAGLIIEELDEVIGRPMLGQRSDTVTPKFRSDHEASAGYTSVSYSVPRSRHRGSFGALHISVDKTRSTTLFRSSQRHFRLFFQKYSHYAPMIRFSAGEGATTNGDLHLQTRPQKTLQRLCERVKCFVKPVLGKVSEGPKQTQRTENGRQC
ncbi:hypothetical protein VTI74DRAFT_3360 [Chaetomium olivicolor]